MIFYRSVRNRAAQRRRHAFERQRHQDLQRRRVILDSFPGRRRSLPDRFHPSNPDPLPEFGMSSVEYRFDGNDNMASLRNYRLTHGLMENPDFNISDPHLAVFIHDLPSFIPFFDEHLRGDVRVIRTIVFERATLEFPDLNRFLSQFTHLLRLEFRQVDFVMTSWRNQHDQEFLFGNASSPRVVAFRFCRFLEDFGRILFRNGPDDDHFEKNEAGEWVRGYPTREELMASRSPVLFYHQLAARQDLVSLRETGNHQ